MSTLRIANVSLAEADATGGQAVTVSDGTFTSVTTADSRDVRSEVDGTGLTISPGFIDIQVNGGHGIDINTSPEDLWRLGAELPRYGVTSFLPTLISGPPGCIDRTLTVLRRRPADYRGAEPLGLHLEGPMLNARYRGAHPARYLRGPSLDLVARWTSRRGVAMVTLAPELDGALDVIRHLTSQGVVVSAGHTAATAQEAIQAIRAGVRSVTHTFNAMAPLDHRHPTLLAAVLAHPSVVTAVIADGIHLHPHTVELLWSIKGPGALILTTDSVAAMGEPPGRYTLGDTTIHSDSTGARLENGTLAGSSLSMIRAARNLVSFTGCRVSAALRCASRAPADLLARPERGRIEVGAVADFTLLDGRLDVALTVCRGRIAFVAPGAQERIRSLPGER